MRRLWIFSVLYIGTLFVGFAQDYRFGPEEKDYAGYLFASFRGHDESVYFAVSLDGFSYYALNEDRPVLDSKQISSTGGVRDPHILRSEDGNTFYMVLTDMTAAKGWDSNRAMVLLKSNDLIDWTSTVIHIQQRYSGHDSLKRVWAPQTIYDPEAGKYMVYWSMKHGQGPDIIYYAYANESFTDFEGEPRVLFRPQNGMSCIDADIVFKNGLYHMFYKTEGGDVKGIKRAITNSLQSGVWIEQADYKQQTPHKVEGSCLFKLNHEDRYILMYDVYTQKHYQFCESVDLDVFRVIDDSIRMDFKPRHGTIVSLTRWELNRLLKKWGTPEGFEAISDVNPVIPGYYADPEILYSEKNKKYYLYPTSDGFNNWGGYYFKTFSSDNLSDWKDEGVILDLRKDVSWASNNAWAPCIIEKKQGRSYKYYYYFSAEKKIGVAVADEPTGPFVDLGKPLIDKHPPGVKNGQEIDPDVFHDPVSGKYFLYWGSGYLAMAELNKDMMSVKDKTIQAFKRPSTFREGVYVFYRKGLYYFIWSENDTRDPQYRLRYATSKSPMGPLDIPADNLILTMEASKGIYATGHNSVLQKPGTDDWYVVYHRFGRPDGYKMGRAAGYHREVCIDRMSFDADGRILPIAPSL